MSKINYFKIRAAEPRDCIDVFLWRNDRISRKMSLNGERISLDEHVLWFASALSDPLCSIYICENMEDGVGYAVVRFVVRFDVATVSISLAPNVRGKGLSSNLLRSTINLFVKSNPGIVTLKAYVKHVNLSSRRMFDNLGFNPISVDNEMYELAFEAKDFKLF